MKKPIKFIMTAAVTTACCIVTTNAQVASNGNYSLNQTVIAAGGETSSDSTGSIYKIEGTLGQPIAGTLANAGVYSIRSGFWSPISLSPTAANGSISGRIVTRDGAGIRNVIVVLTGGGLFTPRTSRSGTFGNFTFEDVEVGHVYTLSVQSKKYGFPQDSQVLSLMDNVADIIFQADREN